MNKGYFITGTDTGVGKSLVATALIHYFVDKGLKACGMKPVASGCVETSEGLANSDADSLHAASNVMVDYATLSPYRFLPPIAPHIASEQAGIRIDIEHLLQCYETLQSLSDTVVVEGAGGWHVSLNQNEYLSDFAKEIALPVIIVVGGRLGCINHALLTAEAVVASGLNLAGWVFNQIEPDMLEVDAVKQSLKSRMPGKMIADISWQDNPKAEDIYQLFKQLN